MKSAASKIAGYLGLSIRRGEIPQHTECVSLKTAQPHRGNVLLAYIVEPFLERSDGTPPRFHTHHAESRLIARVFLDRGYNVDAIDYRNRSFKPSIDYSFFVSARTNFVRLAQRLNSDCVKIAHLDTAHFLFNNAMAYRRALELQQRRGITTTSFRVIEHNYAVEHADFLTMLGNRFTESTYSFANKRIFPLPVPVPDTATPEDDRDFAKCKSSFLWLGSEGLVHKGLDILLEVFSEMPEYQLTVCGPLDTPAEKGFVEAYSRELYETPNINAVGWIDVGSEQFKKIANRCSALVYPSCSEGQAGSVISCLKAGLIPVISYESGVDVEGFGTILEQCSHREIKAAIVDMTQKSNEELAGLSHRAYEYAQRHHSSEAYLNAFGRVIDDIEHQRQRVLF